MTLRKWSRIRESQCKTFTFELIFGLQELKLHLSLLFQSRSQLRKQLLFFFTEVLPNSNSLHWLCTSLKLESQMVWGRDRYWKWCERWGLEAHVRPILDSMQNITKANLPILSNPSGGPKQDCGICFNLRTKLSTVLKNVIFQPNKLVLTSRNDYYNDSVLRFPSTLKWDLRPLSHVLFFMHTLDARL